MRLVEKKRFLGEKCLWSNQILLFFFNVNKVSFPISLYRNMDPMNASLFYCY